MRAPSNSDSDAGCSARSSDQGPLEVAHQTGGLRRTCTRPSAVKPCLHGLAQQRCCGCRVDIAGASVSQGLNQGRAAVRQLLRKSHRPNVLVGQMVRCSRSLSGSGRGGAAEHGEHARLLRKPLNLGCANCVALDAASAWPRRPQGGRACSWRTAGTRRIHRQPHLDDGVRGRPTCIPLDGGQRTRLPHISIMIGEFGH